MIVLKCLASSRGDDTKIGILEISLNSSLLLFSSLGSDDIVFTILSKNFLVISFLETTAFSNEVDNYKSNLKKSLDLSSIVYVVRSTFMGFTFSVF